MKKPDYAIRQAHVADLGAVQSCAIAAYSKYIERIGREPAPMVADFSAIIDTDHMSVICKDNTVLGFVVFYAVENAMHLENVAIFPEYAGCGVGRLLIEHVESTAARLRLESVNLYTNEAMTENLTLYPALGYREIERRTESGFKRVYFSKFIKF